MRSDGAERIAEAIALRARPRLAVLPQAEAPAQRGSPAATLARRGPGSGLGPGRVVPGGEKTAEVRSLRSPEAHARPRASGQSNGLLPRQVLALLPKKVEAE